VGVFASLALFKAIIEYRQLKSKSSD